MDDGRFVTEVLRNVRLGTGVEISGEVLPATKERVPDWDERMRNY